MNFHTNHTLLNIDNMVDNSKRRRRAYLFTQSIREPNSYKYNNYDTNDVDDDIIRMISLESSCPFEVQQELLWLRLQLCEKNEDIRKLKTKLDISINEIQMKDMNKFTNNITNANANNKHIYSKNI